MAEAITLKEPLSGGWVNARHPALLDIGELGRAENVFYHPNDRGLYRAWGRSLYAQLDGAFVGKVKGLRQLSFDDTLDADYDDLLVAYEGSTYHCSVFTGRAGSFAGGASNITNVGTGATLDAVHYSNRHYLLNGNTGGTRNKVIKAASGSISSRDHGVLPVADGPTVATQAGQWPLDPVYFGEGRFFFFTTEVLNVDTGDELESIFDGTPTSIDLQKDGTGNIALDVKVTRPTNVFNSGAPIFRLYMAKAPLFAPWDPSMFARARQIGQGAISATAASDFILISQFGIETTYNLPTVATLISGSVDDQNRIKLIDNVGAKNTGSGESTTVIDAKSFGFAGIAGTITGITVRAKGQRGINTAGSAWTRAKLTPDITIGSPVFSSEYQFYGPQGPNWYQTWTTRVRGGPNDLWGLAWAPADFNTAGKFAVRLSLLNTGGKTARCEIDSVEVRVHTAAAVTVGKYYPIVSYQVGNLVTVESANNTPPIASTGDVYDGQLVTNDVTDPSIIKYSLPDQPDYFPFGYFVNFETKEQDRVTCIRALGDILIVSLSQSIYRLNYLPLATDAEFNRGRCRELLAPDIGVAGSQAADLFTPPGAAPMLCMMTMTGPYITDGSQVVPASQDIDWSLLLEPTKINQCVVQNFPKWSLIRIHYTPLGGSENTKEVLLHYHPSQLKNGKFRATGPNDVKAGSSTAARLGNELVLFTGNTTDGKVYCEDNSVNDASSINPAVLVETRDIYAAGPGSEWTLERDWLFHNQTSPAITYSITPYMRNTEGDLLTGTAKTVTSTKDGLSRLDHHNEGEMIRFRIAIADSNPNNAAAAMHYLLFLAAGHGLSERPRS